MRARMLRGCRRQAAPRSGPRARQHPAPAPTFRTTRGGLDQAIGQLLIDTLTPLAAEAALTVTAELQHRADDAEALRAAHVERASYHADLTAEHRDLMPQHQNLRFFGRLASAQQHQPARDPDNDQV